MDQSSVRAIRRHPLVFGGAVASILSGLVSMIVSIESTKKILKTINAKVPQSVKNSLKSMIPTIYLKYLMENTSFGQGIFKLFSFLGIEGFSLGIFTLVLTLGGYSFLLFLISSGIIFLLGKPLEYVEYISCSILESQYIRNGLKTPYNVAETMAKYKKITVDKYYEDLKLTRDQNWLAKNSFINWIGPIARLNITIIEFLVKYYGVISKLMMIGLGAGGVYGIYWLLLQSRKK